MAEENKTPEELAAEQAAQAAAAAAADTAEEITTEEVVTDPSENTPGDDDTSEEEVDYLSMSDEEIEKLGALEDQVPATEPKDEGERSSETKGQPEAKVEDKSASTPEGETKTGTEAKPAVSEKVPESKSSSDTPVAPTVVDPLKVSDEAAVAAYKQIFAPFKANNKDVQARTPEEAVRLMQMGAGHMRYKKRVEPMLARAQTLANANIDEEELNFLIELKNKKPEAIKKLVRDAGLDPYDISTDEAAKAADKNYRPADYSASQKQIALQETLETTKSQEGGVEVLTEMRTSWDDNSRQMALEDPEIISALVQQKQAGIYDQITAEIEHRRTLGQLANEPFLNAYHKVGLEMTENGMFVGATNTPGSQQKSQIMTKSATPEILETRTVPPGKQEKAAKAAKALAPVAAKPTAKVDPHAVLHMSDEEFEKMAGMDRFV